MLSQISGDTFLRLLASGGYVKKEKYIDPSAEDRLQFHVLKLF